MKKGLVCGAGGFIGGHPSTELRAGLVKKLKREGYWVRGVGGKLRQGDFSLSQEAGAGVKRATDVHD